MEASEPPAVMIGNANNTVIRFTIAKSTLVDRKRITGLSTSKKRSIKYYTPFAGSALNSS